MHATGEPEDYAEVAWQRGLAGLLVTCHNPMPHGFAARVRMREDEFGEYVDMVARARETWAGRIDVRLGLECDYFPGFESWLERQVASAEFHYLLGSIHPQLFEYRERFWKGDAIEFQREYFHQIACTAETGLFDSISHPDFVKNQTPDQWDPDRIMDDIKRSLDRIAKAGVAMELNTSGVNKTVPEMNPFPGMLVEMRKRRIPVVVGSDAHVPYRVGDGFEVALDLLEECGYEHVSYFVDRRRTDVSIDQARSRLTAAVGP
jgi:histidinol-phosphatase (PHP family)